MSTEAADDPLAVAAGVEVLGLDGRHERADGAVVGALLLGVLRICPPRDEQRQQEEHGRGRPDLGAVCHRTASRHAEQAVGRGSDITERAIVPWNTTDR